MTSKPGIKKVNAAPLTGHLLVLFNAGESQDSLFSFLKSLRCDMAPSEMNLSLNTAGISLNATPCGETWHSIPPASLMTMLNSRNSGLSEDESRERLRRFGPNTLESLSVRSALQIWIDQFRSIPVGLLGVAAALSLMTAGTFDMALILGTIGFNAIVGFAIDFRTEQKIGQIWRLGRPTVTVMREGKREKVPTDRIVPGDILVLGAGSLVSADARVLEASHLELDESAVTKRVTLQAKWPVETLSEDTPLEARNNMIYRGGLVVHGHGLALVVTTGTATELGRLKLEEIITRAPETRLEKQLAALENQLTFVGVIICGAVLVIGFFRGYPFLDILTLSVSLGGGAIPEGLSTIAATTLSLGVSKARRHHVLIRRLKAVETLGSIETFCFDKTGMVTIDRPAIVALYTGMRRIVISDFRFFSNGEEINLFQFREIAELIRYSVLCNRSVSHQERGHFVFQGPSLDNAFLELAAGSGFDIHDFSKKFPRLKVKDSGLRKGFLITVHPLSENQKLEKHLIAIRGDASDLLPLCRWLMVSHLRVPMTEENRMTIETEIDHLTVQGTRVIGFAYKESSRKVDHDRDESHTEKDLVWIGLVGVVDPIKEGVKPLITSLQQAGIETVMLTEDPPSTASVIGKKLELERDGALITLDSPELSEMAPELVKALTEKVQIISRATAVQKQKIVKMMQSRGRIVAMTGDELADIPSMMSADIGIALGQSGREMARDVAEVVLEENNLETMVIAVSYGRSIYNNIRKSVHYLLSTNLSEVFLVSFGIAVGTGTPLNALQLLWIDLLSDTLPSFALAFEPPQPDVMRIPPRPADKPILEPSDLSRIAFEGGILAGSAFGAYGYGLFRYGPGRKAGTIAFMGLMLGQIFHLQSCRSEQQRWFGLYNGPGTESLRPNRILQGTLLGSLVLQGMAIALPGLRNILGLVPITLVDGTVVAGSALLPLIVNEATKPN